MDLEYNNVHQEFSRFVIDWMKVTEKLEELDLITKDCRNKIDEYKNTLHSILEENNLDCIPFKKKGEQKFFCLRKKSTSSSISKKKLFEYLNPEKDIVWKVKPCKNSLSLSQWITNSIRYTINQETKKIYDQLSITNSATRKFLKEKNSNNIYFKLSENCRNIIKELDKYKEDLNSKRDEKKDVKKRKLELMQENSEENVKLSKYIEEITKKLGRIRLPFTNENNVTEDYFLSLRKKKDKSKVTAKMLFDELEKILSEKCGNEFILNQKEAENRINEYLSDYENREKLLFELGKRCEELIEPKEEYNCIVLRKAPKKNKKRKLDVNCADIDDIYEDNSEDENSDREF